MERREGKNQQNHNLSWWGNPSKWDFFPKISPLKYMFPNILGRMEFWPNLTWVFFWMNSNLGSHSSIFFRDTKLAPVWTSLVSLESRRRLQKFSWIFDSNGIDSRISNVTWALMAPSFVCFLECFEKHLKESERVNGIQAANLMFILAVVTYILHSSSNEAMGNFSNESLPRLPCP